MRILVIEDEFSLADIIATKLRSEKYSVDISLDGEGGLDNGLSGIYDLIILDVMLPKINGIDVLKEIRRHDKFVKIIMLTAKSSLDDKLLGFENGDNTVIGAGSVVTKDILANVIAVGNPCRVIKEL